MLEFEIKNQTIKRIDRFNPATDSVDYLTAKFNFLTTDWNGYSKTAIFKVGTESYSVLLKDNACKVPYEVLVASEKSRSQLVGNNKIFVSVFGTKGTSRVPTNEIRIDLETSGYTEGKTPEAPKADVYAQILDGQAQIETEQAKIREELTERANALKGNASGEVVRVNDVSPVEHKAKIKVHGKNLLPMFYVSDFDRIGITATLNANGTITLNGTTNRALGIRAPMGDGLPAGTYTISNSNPLPSGVWLSVSNGDLMIGAEATKKTVTLDNVIDEAYLFIYVNEGVEFNNFVVNLQVELGNTATEYEPYLDPSSVTVTRCGKNFVDLSVIITDKQNQVVNNGNGTITVNTSATSSAVPMEGVPLKRLAPSLVVGKTYTLSANSTGTQKKFWLDIANYAWNFGEAAIITQEMLNSIVFVYASGNSTSAVVSNIQIEKGNNATAYEPYKEAETYTPDTDGNCEITSLAPTMTLLTDTAGVTIDLEYNKDINAENEAVRADITELDRITGEHTTLVGSLKKALTDNLNFQDEEITLEWYRKSVTVNSNGTITHETFSDSTTRLINREAYQTENYFDITDKTINISVAEGFKYACALYRCGASDITKHHMILKSQADWKYYTEPTTWVADGDYKYLVIMLVKVDNSELLLSEASAIKIETPDSTTNGVKTRIKQLEETVNDFARNSALSGKKWLFIGDSITEHNFRSTKNYDEYLQDWFDIIPINLGMSGTGVTYPFGSNPSWLNKMQEYPEDVDVISVMGALNDRHTTLGQWGDRGTDTVYGGVWNYFNNLIEKYPNKPIIYITSTPREYSYGVDGQYTAWVDAFIKTAQNFSIPVLDLYRNSGLRPWNAAHNAEYFSCPDAPTGDGVHPNEKGQKLMALKIMPFAKQYLSFE